MTQARASDHTSLCVRACMLLSPPALQFSEIQTFRRQTLKGPPHACLSLHERSPRPSTYMSCHRALRGTRNLGAAGADPDAFNLSYPSPNNRLRPRCSFALETQGLVHPSSRSLLQSETLGRPCAQAPILLHALDSAPATLHDAAAECDSAAPQGRAP